MTSKPMFGVLVILAAGCRPDLDPIKPVEPVEFHLMAPAGDHAFQVIAMLKVPARYQIEADDAYGFSLYRRQRDPVISVRNTVGAHLTTPDLSRLLRCGSYLHFRRRVVRRESRRGGQGGGGGGGIS